MPLNLLNILQSIFSYLLVRNPAVPGATRRRERPFVSAERNQFISNSLFRFYSKFLFFSLEALRFICKLRTVVIGNTEQKITLTNVKKDIAGVDNDKPPHDPHFRQCGGPCVLVL